ncbi:MAG: cupredoxin domain-containing protein [Rhizobiaceae bacterium]|nr:cupredoxin domain-containing protein [Rhizobiaceae bacterium]
MKRLALALAAATLFAGAATAAEHTVEIKGMRFTPADLRVDAGDTVMFVNRDGTPHTATATGGAFDTGRLDKNESARVAINAGRTFEYFCAVHPSMRGRIAAK